MLGYANPQYLLCIYIYYPVRVKTQISEIWTNKWSHQQLSLKNCKREERGFSYNEIYISVQHSENIDPYFKLKT